MDINGKILTVISVEQLRAISEQIREHKAGAIGSMKSALELMHEQGALLIQAELELGTAFDAFVDQLGNHGVDPMQARANLKLAKKHKAPASLFSDPNSARQLVLQNFAPPQPAKPEMPERSAPAFSLTFHLNTDPLEWSREMRAEFLTKAKPVVKLVEELEG